MLAKATLKIVNESQRIDPMEISIGDDSGWRPLDLARKQMATGRYLKDGDYKRGILSKPKVMWLCTDYIRCADGRIRLFDGKTTTASLQEIFAIWSTPELKDAETWTEELVKDL